MKVLVYINDIGGNIINSKVQLYADDAVVYIENESLETAARALQCDLDSLGRWRNLNKLTINIKKDQMDYVRHKNNA